MGGEIYSRAVRVRAFVDGRCQYDLIKEFLLPATGKQVAVEILKSLISKRVAGAAVVLPLDANVTLEVSLRRVAGSNTDFCWRFARAIVRDSQRYRVRLIAGGRELDIDKPLAEQGAKDWPEGEELKLIVAKVS